MKITKLMLSALVAAAALVSCNKEDLNPEGTGLKTVKISLENAIMTKGEAGNKINAEQAVHVNNIKIFLTNDNYSQEYEAQTSTGAAAQTYFTYVPTEPVDYHFVSSECSRVLVVANCNNENLQLTDLVGEGMQNVLISSQQNQDNLILVGNEEMTRVEDDSDTPEDESIHTNASSGKYTEVYEAIVTLSPIISRFEIDGFAIAFSNSPKYNEIKIQDVAFQNFYNSAKYVSGGFTPNDNNIYKPITDLDDQGSVITWFTDTNNRGWYRDSFTDVTLTNTDATKKKNIAPKAYHFFANESIIPTMIIKVLADGQAAYVYAKEYNIYNGSGKITSLTPGMIYRMNSTAGDGFIEIPDDFDPIERCIYVSVSVEQWAVTLVKPDFNND